MTATTDSLAGTAGARTTVGTPLPDRSRRARRLGTLHGPHHRPRRGLVAGDHGWRALSRLHVGHRRDQHRSRPPAVTAAVAAQAVKLLHGQQNIVYHEPGLRLHARLADLAPARGLGRLPVQQRRGSGRGRRQAGACRDRSAGDRGLPGRLPRPNGTGDVADHIAGHGPRRLRAVARLGLPRSLPGPAIGVVRIDAALRRRLGGRLWHPCSPSSSTRQAGRCVHHRAGHRRGRLHRAAGLVPAPAARDWPPSTASCSSRTRSRPASAAPGASGRWTTGVSSRTSIVMAKGIASGLPLSGILAPRETLATVGARGARRHLRRQCRGVRGGTRDARRDRARGPRRQCCRTRGAAARGHPGDPAGSSRAGRCARARRHGRARVRRSHGHRSADPRPCDRQAGHRRRRSPAT